MIVLDANVVIAHLDADDGLHDAATDLLLGAAHEPFGMPALTIAEVLVGPARAGRLAAMTDAMELLRIVPLPLTAEAAVPLAELRASTGLKMPDCMVLLAALGHGSTVATFDQRLAAAARARGLTVVPQPG